MISDKMIELTHSSSVIRAMFEEGNRLTTLHGRENVFDFSIGNPSIPPPDAVREAIIDIATNVEPLKLHGYMTNAGHPEVRKAIADSLNTKYETSFDENNIVMSSGAAGGMNVVFKALLNPGDEVIIISPFFLEYTNYVTNYDGVPVIVPANPENFYPDVDAICDAITPKTKVVVLNNPNNPTGVVYSEEVILQLTKLLEEKSRKIDSPIYLLSDEPYREIVYEGAKVPFLTKYYKNTIVCYSWSKSLSLPGQRIGYVIIPNEADSHHLIFDAVCIATRILGYMNASALIQRVVAKCLEEESNIAAYDANRKLLYDNLASLGFDIVFPEGTFYMWMKTPVDDKEFVNKAKDFNILIVPGSGFFCSGYARIAYCVAFDTIERSLPAFKKLANEYKLT